MIGATEVDETFIGGKVKNMHLMKKIRKQLQGEIKGGGWVGKAIVMGVLQRNKQDSQVRPVVLAELRKTDTDEHLKNNVEAGEKIYTDEAQHYKYLPDYANEFIDHSEAYVKGAVHVNGLENFWCLLKRSLAGTYVSVEPFHLQAYVDEQAYRFNNRKSTPAQRFADVMANVYGKRVTWNDLTGKDGDERTPIEKW